jgi:predicted transcriptional regulator
MATTTVRVPEEVHAQLRQLASQTGASLQSVLSAAVEQFRRSWILIETNAAYSRIAAERSDVDEEYSELEVTLLDGLDDD